MNVIILGAGNTATVLAKKIKNAGHNIVQVYNHTLNNAKLLADTLICKYTDNISQIDKTADIYIVAIKDIALSALHYSLNLGNKIVLHTAGSVPQSVLEKVSKRYGTLYPLQSLKKDTDPSVTMPLLIDGSDEDTLKCIEDFAKSISDHVKKTNDNERLKLHVAAVVVNNFANHLYVLAKNFCDKEEVDFNLLKPLMMETVSRLNHSDPVELQTGPAVRNDTVTLNKHLMALSNHPKLKYIYVKMTDSIINNLVAQ